MSWIDAVNYCQWLARVTGKPYRLIRDAEYEKAARGGLEGKKYPWGDEDLEGRADFGRPDGSPMPVGSFAPNGYGLYDMIGSSWSWCEERYDEIATHDKANHIYEDTMIRDMRQNPILRGGSYKTRPPMQLHCAYRHEDPMDGRFDCVSFRIAM